MHDETVAFGSPQVIDPHERPSPHDDGGFVGAPPELLPELLVDEPGLALPEELLLLNPPLLLVLLPLVLPPLLVPPLLLPPLLLPLLPPVLLPPPPHPPPPKLQQYGTFGS